jgi:hypothetical protein
MGNRGQKETSSKGGRCRAAGQINTQVVGREKDEEEEEEEEEEENVRE